MGGGAEHNSSGLKENSDRIGGRGAAAGKFAASAGIPMGRRLDMRSASEI